MSERPPISPRSPRAALEPEQVPPPPKRSERARNPFVVAGNAIITIVLVLMIGVGGGYIYGRQKIEAPGPLQEDKVVNIPARSGMSDIADTLHNLAETSVRLGQFNQAVEQYLRALDLRRKANDKRGGAIESAFVGKRKAADQRS